MLTGARDDDAVQVLTGRRHRSVARIKQSPLPDGALKSFFDALHELHLRAGYPSTREIQRDIGREYASHTTIHKAISGPRLPGWAIIEPLVEALAQRARQDSDTTIEQFKSLWQSAATKVQDTSASKIDQVRSVTEVSRDKIRHQGSSSFAALLPDTLDEIEATGTRKVNRELVPTGFADVDALTGGMRAGSLVVIAARPSIGKTTLLLTICANTALKYGLGTAVFSSEMTEREIQMRLLAAESRVPHHSLRSGFMTEQDWARLAQKMSGIVDSQIWLSYSAYPNITALENEARILSDENQLRLIAIDNLDALAVCNDEPEKTLYRLKRLAGDLKVPILATACIRNQAPQSNDSRPEVDGLWNSDPVAAIADILVLLDRPDAYDVESPRVGEIDLVFVKNRHGPTATVTLAFQSHYSRAVDLFISSNSEMDWSFNADKEPDDDSGDDSGKA